MNGEGVKNKTAEGFFNSNLGTDSSISNGLFQFTFDPFFRSLTPAKEEGGVRCYSQTSAPNIFFLDHSDVFPAPLKPTTRNLSTPCSFSLSRLVHSGIFFHSLGFFFFVSRLFILPLDPCSSFCGRCCCWIQQGQKNAVLSVSHSVSHSYFAHSLARPE